MGGRARPAGVAVGTFAALVAIFLFAHGPMRGFVGDVVVVVWLDAVLAAIGVASPRVRLAGVGVISVGLEGLQALELVGSDAHWLAHAVLGSTFDPLDMVAYGVGLGLAWLLEAWWYPRPPAMARPADP